MDLINPISSNEDQTNTLVNLIIIQMQTSLSHLPDDVFSLFLLFYLEAAIQACCDMTLFLVNIIVN